jgi:S1-C subfamily serine protease
VLFDGTAQNFRASLERVHPEVDLALVRVVIRGGTPVAADLADQEAVGTPVATLTFPLELDLAPGAAWRQTGVTATAFRATVVAVDANLLELEGYGAEGMSGSPVFNAGGAVVGVIFGGGAGTRGRVVLAVPAGRVRELLNGRGERESVSGER